MQTHLIKAAVQKISSLEDDTCGLSQEVLHQELELILESFLLILRRRRMSKNTVKAEAKGSDPDLGVLFRE